MTGHLSPITALTYSPTGTLVSVGYDGQVIAWDQTLRAPRWQAQHADLLNDVVVVGARVYVTGAERTVSVHRLDDGGLIRTYGGDDADDLNGVVVVEEADLLIGAGEEGRLRAWSLAHGTERWTRQLPDECINTLALAPLGDGLGVMAGGDEGLLSFTSLTGEARGAVSLGSAIESLCTVPHRGLVAAGLEDGRLVLVDPGEARIVTDLRLHQSTVRTVAARPDGHELATASYDGSIVLFSLTPELELIRLKYGGAAGRGWARGLAYHPGNPRLLASASLGQAPQLWDTCRARLALADAGSTFGLNAMAVGPDGVVLVAGDDGAVTRVDTSAPGHVATVGSMVNGIDISPCGTVLATVSHDGRLRLFDLPDGTLRTSIAISRGPLNAVRFDSSGDRLGLAAYDGTAQVWRTDGPTAEHRFSGGRGAVKDIGWLDGDRALVAGTADGVLTAWELPTERVRFVREGLYLVNSIAVSADGRRFVTVGRDQRLRLWLDDGELLAEVVGHQRSIKGVALSPDGSHLATASYDGDVRIWRVEPHAIVELPGICRGHAKPGVPVVRWLNNDYLASAGWDATARFWNRSGLPVGLTRLGPAA